MIRVLIVDDEKPIRDLIGLNLSAGGYHCTSVQDGAETLRLIENQFFDLILFNIILPGVDGYDIMSYVRPMDIPVVFITARHGVGNGAKGLRLGVDDYLVEPFGVMELVARVGVVLRRYSRTERLLTAGDVTMGVEARRVTRADRNVELTSKEFGLLVLFIQNKDVTLLREILYEKVWEGECSGGSRTLGLHVQRLRRKLGWKGNLVAAYKVGYRPEVVQ